MPDLAPRLPAHALDLAGGVRREVVVQHELVAGFTGQVVDQDLVALGAEGRHAQHLRLAAREDGRAVGAGQGPRLNPDRAHRAGVSAVGPQVFLQDQAAKFLLLDFVKSVLEGRDLGGGSLGLGVGNALGNQPVAQGLDAGAAVFFAAGQQGVAQSGGAGVLGEFRHHVHRQVGLGGKHELLVAEFGLHLLDQGDNRLHLGVGKFNRADQHVLIHGFRAGFDHQDGVLGAGHHQVHAAVLELAEGRIDDERPSI